MILTMKRYYLLLLCMLAVCTFGYAQSVVGDWEGTLKTPMGELALVLHLTEQDSKWSATFDSPMQGAFGLKANKVEVNESAIDVEVANLGMRYRAKLVGNELQGEFTQGAAKLPLLLRRKPQKEKQSDKPYTEREVTIENSKAGIKLVGTLTLPREVKQGTPLIVMITGSGPQNRDEELFGHKPFAVLSDTLTRAGYLTFRYDDRGVGASTGEFFKASMGDLISDAESVYKQIAQEPEVDSKRIILLGHSEGSYIAATLASKYRDVFAVVSLAGPTLPFGELLIGQIDRISELSGISSEQRARSKEANQTIYTWAGDQTIPMEELRSKVESYSRAMLLTTQNVPKEQIDGAVSAIVSQVCTPWFREFVNIDPTPVWWSIRCPIIGLFGSKDVQVLPSNADRLRTLKSNASIKVFDGLNHMFQPANTGLPKEYGQIKTTISTEVLDYLLSELAKLHR